MSDWDFVLRGGLLIDGSGGQPVVGDVAVAGDRIAAIGHLPHPPPPGAAVLDCQGLAVAPGFIDAHTHSDLTLLAAPEATTHLMQGVTTDICGNCGWSAFPARGERVAAVAEEAAACGLAVGWSDLPGFLRRIAQRPAAINRGLLVGHGMVRGSVMGCEDRPATAAELADMRAEVQLAMELGCLGMSSGLIYPPGIFARTEELVELARVVAQFGGIYTSHVRSEGRELEAAVEEFLAVGRGAGVRLQISHLKVAGQDNWPKIDWLLDRLQRARTDEGLALTADRYPYLASETGLDAILPGWAYEGGREKELARLEDPATRARLAAEIDARMTSLASWAGVIVGTVQEPSLRDLQGRSLAEIAAARACPPIEVLFDLLLADRARTAAMYHGMSEDHLARILSMPWAMIGSDSSSRGTSGPTAAGWPHPRGAGTFPRILARYVRQEKLLTLGEAVRRMTSLPAATFALQDRGVLRPGAFADIIVFDPDRFADQSDYQHPQSLPTGLTHVLINGRPAVRDGQQTAERPGRVLKGHS
jgi:N-acyl-D-amino-acid deacylase